MMRWHTLALLIFLIAIPNGDLHVGDADTLSFEVGDLVDETVSRHRDAVDVSLVSGVKDFRFDSLGASGRERLHARQCKQDLLGADRLDTVCRASQRHQLNLDVVFLVPAHLGGDGKRRGGRGDHPGTEADP